MSGGMNLTEAREHFGVREWRAHAPVAVRLLRKIAEDENGCWIWTGAFNAPDRYGVILSKVDGQPKLRLAHRTAYELIVGPIPPGHQIDHLCRVTACCNPAHLEAVTPGENTRRGAPATKTTCAQGHDYAPNTGRSGNGRRFCRECKRLRARAAWAAKKARR